MTTLVGSAAAGNQNSTTITMTWPADLQADDLALLWWSHVSTATPTTGPPAFTLTEAFTANTGNHISRMYTKTLTGTESGTFDLIVDNANRHSACLVIYRGVSGVDTYVVADTAASSTSHTPPTLVTGVPDTSNIQVYAERLGSGTTDITAPTDYIRRVHTSTLASGTGGTYVAVADDGLTVSYPGNASVTPDPWTGSALTDNVVMWSVSLAPEPLPDLLWRAGEIVDFRGLNARAERYVLQTDNQSVTSSTAYIDSALRVTFPPDQRYLIRVELPYEASTTGDFKWAYSYSGGSEQYHRFTQAYALSAGSGVNTGADIIMRRLFRVTDGRAGGTGAGNVQVVREEGHFLTGTGGELVLRFSQWTSDATPTILRNGGILRYRRIQ